MSSFTPEQIQANRAYMEANRAAGYTDGGYPSDMFRSTFDPDTKTRLDFTANALTWT